MPATVERERNPARSRAAILDAAERLFAEQGYDATSLTEVGAAAGVSRGTPGLLLRLQGRALPAPFWTAASRGTARRSAQAARGRWPASQPAETILAGAVSDYFDFLAARPNFIRLIEREALSGGGPARGRRATSPPGRRRWPRSAPSSASTTPPRATRPSCCSASSRSAGSPDPRPHRRARPSASRSTMPPSSSGASAT